ncbi:TetR/AcrR family transcriptional regulator [Microbacterium saperdae]|uniref:TetR family transcriptional regulator n=1 Tax=Microbacterium saperdae TaxID=69368 RepID=A0A543BMI4_9MICO|nr:TetR family transcriptional regulator [Microbacterium saperdae]TQL86023.1 TetR family transcriptional regulator [Microbacterium saperdae]GGM51184.1 TetR family transcriptional regulator [Microbacterium saperdae]
MFENDALESKSARTRARISAAAIESFIERGYADTTMRLIAEKAEVSVGNAYYYFPSKNHLVQDLYVRVQQEHAATAHGLLAEHRALVDRLRIVFETGLAALVPYQRSAPGFLAAMIAPDSPINPLSAESAPARDMTVGLFREAVEGAQHRLPTDVADLLPEALFVSYLGLVLRWTYDGSPDQEKTSRMLDAGLRLLAIALPFVRMPGVHSTTRELLRLVTEVRS